MNTSTEYMYKVLSRFAAPLSVKTGRSPDAIVTDGLRASDFPGAGLYLRLEDGTHFHFKYAFAVKNPDFPSNVAIFTEHNGYFEFTLSEDEILTDS